MDELAGGWILLTNDDGIDSPALLPFARALATLGPVRVVVPDHERSWVGKAITRHDPVRIDRVDGDVWTCSGYPADAVQLGVHVLFDTPPSVVVSGINLGYNHGAGYLMSSGTVGAAVEGWIAGIPGVAFSVGTTTDWPGWRRRVHSPDSAPGWERTAGLCTRILADVLAAGVFELADVVSVNLPFDPPPGTERRVTTLARTGYDRLFSPGEEGTFIHDFGGGLHHRETLDGSDVAAAEDGVVALTAVRMPEARPLPVDVRARLEGRT